MELVTFGKRMRLSRDGDPGEVTHPRSSHQAGKIRIVDISGPLTTTRYTLKPQKHRFLKISANSIGGKADSPDWIRVSETTVTTRFWTAKHYVTHLKYLFYIRKRVLRIISSGTINHKVLRIKKNF